MSHFNSHHLYHCRSIHGQCSRLQNLGQTGILQKICDKLFCVERTYFPHLGGLGAISQPSPVLMATKLEDWLLRQFPKSTVYQLQDMQLW
jgi:hypothetical protein